jgi:hypothetical protein
LGRGPKSQHEIHLYALGAHSLKVVLNDFLNNFEHNTNFHGVELLKTFRVRDTQPMPYTVSCAKVPGGEQTRSSNSDLSCIDTAVLVEQGSVRRLYA